MRLFIYCFLSLSLISCNLKRTIVTPEYVGLNRDSLLVNYLLDHFDNAHRSKNSLENQLKLIRSGNFSGKGYTKSIRTKFDQFYIEAFSFDSQHYPPFAVEISDDNNKLLSLFTFTDELYYGYNSIHSYPQLDSLVLESITSNSSFFDQKLNLEKNLNALIIKFQLQNDPERLRQFIDTLLQTTLEMPAYQDSEIQEIIRKLDGDAKAVELVKQEFDNFIAGPSDRVLRLRSKDGFYGYWRILIMEEDNKYIVRVRFFSDVLFTVFYM